MECVTLRIWHKGLFKKSNNELKYFGGEGRTFNIDPDELSWFWLEELAKTCGLDEYKTHLILSQFFMHILELNVNLMQNYGVLTQIYVL